MNDSGWIMGFFSLIAEDLIRGFHSVQYDFSSSINNCKVAREDLVSLVWFCEGKVV